MIGLEPMTCRLRNSSAPRKLLKDLGCNQHVVEGRKSFREKKCATHSATLPKVDRDRKRGWISSPFKTTLPNQDHPAELEERENPGELAIR